jgi:hypothetical protein
VHENRRKRRRRISAAAAAIATSLATLVGLVGFTGAPAFAGTNANTSYEFDCTTSLSAGQVAPFIVTANLNAAPDPSFPSGATFGASGALSFTLSGGFIAGFAANGVLLPGGVGLTVHDLALSSTDGTATGSYAYNQTFAKVVPGSSTLSATWASASTTLSGAFAAGDVGKGVTGGTGLPSGATIVAVNPGVSATINAPTTAAQVAAVSITLWDGVTFTDAAVSTGNAFTTNGTAGGNANIGATSASGFDANVNLTVPFGAATGGEGVGTANCLETGWDASANPGPAQTGAATPQTPPGSTTPLVLASGGFVAQPGTAVQITPAASSFVALADAPPVAQNASYNLGVGQSKTITLIATDTDATPVTGFSIVGAPSDARLTVGSPAANGDVTVTDAGSGPAVVTFQFTATDGVGTSNTGTATVNIGTPPVDEPLTQNVIGGQLVVSCSNPDTNGGTPLLTCPEFQFPAITLNGLQQTSTGSGATLYVSDNRGDPSATAWSLTASMVATPIGVGSNTNASCAGIVAFCNENVATHALDASGNGQIAKGNLAIGAISCLPHAGNLNPAPTPGAGGTFASTQQICQAVSSTQQGGTFDVTKSYTLTIPSSVYAGKYWGTVEFLVQ